MSRDKCTTTFGNDLLDIDRPAFGTKLRPSKSYTLPIKACHCVFLSPGLQIDINS